MAHRRHGWGVVVVAALTSVSNGGWIAYFALPILDRVGAGHIRDRLAGALAVLLARRGGVPPGRRAHRGLGRPPRPFLGGPAAAGLGTALTASFVLQVAPSVWTAYRTTGRPGSRRGTWSLILAELFCWGAYGLHKSDLGSPSSA